MDDRISKIVKNPAFVPSVTGVVCFGLGFVAGYILARRTEGGEVEVHELPDSLELHFTKDQLNDLRDVAEKHEGEPVDLVVLDDDDDSVISEEDKIAMMPVDENITITIAEHVEEPEERRNIFAGNISGWVYEVELQNRNPSEPYVLHRDEFFAEENDYPQVSFTYFAGDEIMSDEDESIVYHWAQIVGDLKFGHGSGEPHVFYVRNERRKTEYEVTLDPGHYSVEVLGLELEEPEAELRHHSVQKMRPER